MRRLFSAMPARRLPGLALCGWVAGVALQLQQPVLSRGGVYAGMLLVGVVAAALVGGRLMPVAPVGIRWVALAALALSLGFGLTGLRAVLFQSDALAPALEGRDIELTGRVLAMPQRGDEGWRFRFGVESARLDGVSVRVPPRVYLGWYAGFGLREPASRVGGPDKPDKADAGDSAAVPALRAGERWRMSVRLKAPHGNSNPHGFDYELWLWEQGLQATGYVRAGPRDPAPVRLGDSWRHPVERARQHLRDAVYARVSDSQRAGVVAALLVGDQNAIERADWDVFRATGVAHLLSISGLHITLFAWLAGQGVGGLWRRSTRWTPALCLALPAGSAGAWGGLLLAAAYALLSGWGVPAQRTVWMLATVVLLRQSGQRWPWPQVWLLAMAVVLLLDPWALMQAGFWLSFVAVGVLFAAGSQRPPPPEHQSAMDSVAGGARPTGAAGRFDSMLRLGGRLPGALLRMAREQWTVTLALAPLTLLLFNQVSLVGLLANALAIPWVTLVLTPLTLLGAVWPPLWDLAAAAVAALMVFLQALAAWPLASLSVPAAPLWCALAGVAGGLMLALRLPWHWRGLGLPLLLPVLLWQPLRPAPGEFELLAVDVGQGNAVLVRTAGHTLMYDAGPRFSRESDAGHRVLVPLLRALGDRVDTVVLSHRDSDHIGGAPALLAMQPQARLLSSVEDGHPLQAQRPSLRCQQGQRWHWDGVDFEVLQPFASDYNTPQKSNAMSCVLRIANGRTAALLAGDIELAQEQRLLATGADLRADVLLVPHHGSKTSSSPAFLEAVRPRLALAQVGYRNRFGHPAPPVLARYQERGIRLLSSPVCGAASWHSAQADRVRCQRQIDMRYWQHRLSG